MGNSFTMKPPVLTSEKMRAYIEMQRRLVELELAHERRKEQPGVFNLTQHETSPEQIEAGVQDPSPELKATIRRRMTFGDIPSAEKLAHEAAGLADIAKRSGYYRVMIGGYPALMIHLYLALKAVGLQPVFAHSKRVSVETTDPETGEVTKTSKFKHEGFVTV